jgi:uncharacterized GH25 family protein
MMKSARFRVYVAVVALLSMVCSVGSASAHYLWVTQEAGVYYVARGGLPDKFEPYNPAAVVLIKAFDRDGMEVPARRSDQKEGVSFRADKPVSLAVVMTEWGSRVNTTKGKKLMNRKEAEAQGFKVLQSFTSTQTSKTVFEDNPIVAKALGLKFEIVPGRSPFGLRPGEAMKIMVLFEGSPLKDATVTSGENEKTVTDKDGAAEVVISREGWNVIMAQHRIMTPNDMEHNFRQFMTFLVFKVR